MNISIRSVEPNDLSAVVSLLREFAAFEDLSDYCEVSEEHLYAAMFDERAVVEGLIAFDVETPIGYALFYPNFSSFRGQRGKVERMIGKTRLSEKSLRFQRSPRPTLRPLRLNSVKR